MSQAATASANRRSSPRKKPKNSTKICCVPNAHGLGSNVAMTVLDVSETGIRLILKTVVQLGQHLEIGLEAPGDRRIIKVIAEVVWCAALADGNYCIGARFQKPISYAALQSLVYM